MPRILLLNPPGGKNYARDYYCSKVSKTRYFNQPTDLLIASGFLRRAGFELQVLDALAERLAPAAALRHIDAWAPEAALVLAGAVSWREDREFLSRLRARQPSLRIVLTGDVALEGGAEFLAEHPFIDVLLKDFTSPDLCAYLAGDRAATPALATREHAWGPPPPVHGEFLLPLPAFDLFPARLYRYPLLARRRFATVLSDFGCPYHCAFCTSGRLGYKTRPVDDVMQELAVYAASGIRELYFNNQCFGGDRPRAEELLRAMAAAPFRFGWCAFSRADILLQENFAALLARAGCHTIMLGVETHRPELLARYKNGLTVEEVKAAVALCRRQGLKVLGTFILGFPEDDRDSALELLRYAIALKLDFASFNILAPRPLIPLTAELKARGILGSGRDLAPDQSGNSPVLGTLYLSAEELFRLRNLVERRFYLRPGYLLRRLRDLNSFFQLREHLREAWYVLKK